MGRDNTKKKNAIGENKMNKALDKNQTTNALRQEIKRRTPETAVFIVSFPSPFTLRTTRLQFFATLTFMSAFVFLFSTLYFFCGAKERQNHSIVVFV